jgi:hypothetical protein
MRSLWIKLKDNALNIFTAVLAISTVALTYIGWLQQYTLEKTAETLRAQERAFVYVDTINTSYANDGTLWVMPVVKNSGTTPATGIALRTNWIQFQESIPTGYAYSDFDANGIPTIIPKFGAAIIAPQSTVFAPSAIIPKALIDLVKNGYRHLMVYGSIRYTDKFGQTHITRYCNYVNLTPLINSPQCDNYVCSDTDCKDAWGNPME